MWLVKPASLNQGRGIEIFRHYKDVNHFIFQTPQQTPFWVVQKYVEKPFLYKTRKFDIRMWALVTGDFRIYMYTHGYIRTTSSEYDLRDKNNYVHLTNQCLQLKDKDNYGTFEEGNTLSFDELQRYIDERFPQHKLDIHEHFMPRMKDIAIDTFLSVRN